MASKEYQMLFKLTAEAGKEFNSTFAAASQQMQQIQKEVNALNQAQSDISAYQKQQTAVENTKRKLEDLQKQHDNIQREYEETGESSSTLANRMIDKQRAIDQTTQKLEQQTQKLDQMETELKEAGVDTEHLAEEQQRLSQEMDKAADEMEEAAKEADDFGNKGAAGFEAVGAALVAAGIAEGLKEIAEAYKECVELSMGFQSTMSTVEALSGASAEEMAALTAQAKELGATTRYTATEAGEAMSYMGMAGWSAEQMLAGMPGVLSLAAASGEDLGRVSDIVTDSMTAFGLTAADTSRYADILAATATNANTNVSMMGETFKVVAPLAGSLGYDVEDVAIATGILANSGVKASEAGTSLRGILTRLAKPTKESSDAMDALGISLTDDSGRMYTFMEIMEQVRDSFSGLTEEQKAFYAAELAGQRGMTGLLTIVNASEEDFANLSDKISNCTGAAEKMAQIKLDNLQGQMTLLESATDALKTTIGEAYQNEFQGLAKVATEIMTGVNDFLSKNPIILKSLIAITAEAGAFLAVYTAYQAYKKISIALEPVLIALKQKEAAATAAANAQLLLNPYVAVAAAVVALTVGLIALVEAQDKEAAELRGLTTESREQYNHLQEVTAEYEKAKEVYGENSEEAQKLRWQVEYLTEEYEANKQTVEEYTQAHIDASQAVRDEAVAALDHLRQLENESGYSSVLVDRLKELAGQSTVTAEAQAEMSAIIAKLNDEMPDLALKLDDVLSGKVDFGVIEAFAQARAEAELYAEAQNTLVEQMKARKQESDKVEIAEKDLAAAQEDYNIKLQAYQNIWSSDTTGLSWWFSKEGKDVRAAEEALEHYQDQLDAAKEAQDAANDAYDEAAKIVAEYSGVVDGATEAEQEAITAVTSTVTELQSLATAYNDAYAAAQESFSGQFELFDKAEADADASVEKAQEALNSQLEYWNSYNANIETLKNTSAEALGVTQEQYDALMSYVQSGTEEAAGLAASMADAINEGNEEAVGTLAQTLTEVQTAQDTAAQTVAEWTTGFDQSMDDMLKKANETIDALELSEEAKAAATATMSEYAQAILTQGDIAVENAKSIAQRVQAALNSAKASGGNGEGYAEGTESATPGVHLVGEEGPELVYFEGGEKVIPASETASMMNSVQTLEATPAASAGDGGGFNVALTVNVTGGGDSIDQIQTAGETLRSQLENMLEDYMAERERRVYR